MTTFVLRSICKGFLWRRTYVSANGPTLVWIMTCRLFRVNSLSQLNTINDSKHSETKQWDDAKWMVFYKVYLQMHVCEWQSLSFDSALINVCSRWYNISQNQWWASSFTNVCVNLLRWVDMNFLKILVFVSRKLFWHICIYMIIVNSAATIIPKADGLSFILLITL